MSSTSSLASKLRTLRNNLEVFGLLSTARAALSEILSPRYQTNRFDRRFGTETSLLVSVKDGQLPPEFRKDAKRYEPAVEAVVHHILRRLPIRPEEFVFVDAGCGKGRALLLASMYPFSKIIGVELSPVTSEIARKNVGTFGERAMGLQKCSDIEVLCQNILDFKIPDANIVLFLYNPFQGSLFEDFMQRVYEYSNQCKNREILVVYCNPWSGDEWLRRSGCFKKIYEHRVIMPMMSWNLWVPVRSS